MKLIEWLPLFEITSRAKVNELDDIVVKVINEILRFYISVDKSLSLHFPK